MFLGPESHNSKWAIDMVWELYHSPGRIHYLVGDPSYQDDFAALVTLFSRDYWNRIWVVQEKINAWKIAVYCGPDAISWDKLETVCKLFWENKKLSRLSMTIFLKVMAGVTYW
jgi:hypothetical protein